MRAGWMSILMVAVLATAVRAEDSPTQRAVAYLSREVPHWNKEHKCFSCHNNGDGTRALLVARQQGHKLDPAVLADTLDWLSHPERWENNGGDGEFNDRKLARIQFTSTLATAIETGAIKDRAPLLKAAADLAADQRDDGYWHVEEPGTVGSPATYGNVLATSRALAALKFADARRFGPAIAKAEQWLRQSEPRTTPAAAGVLLALASADDQPAQRQRKLALDFLVRGQSGDGGWGPYTNSPPEVFDTALAVLALAGLPADKQRARRMTQGRKFLRSQQHEKGSWTETTRPAGSQSYAQHMSTTGWATLALLGEE